MDQSHERAVEYIETATRLGHADAQYILGALYCNGQGFERSYEKAREWNLKAAEQGNENAIKGLQRLDKKEGEQFPRSHHSPLNVPPATGHMIHQSTN